MYLFIINDLLYEITNRKSVSTLDLITGYYDIPVKEMVVHLTAFHYGDYVLCFIGNANRIS